MIDNNINRTHLLHNSTVLFRSFNGDNAIFELDYQVHHCTQMTCSLKKILYFYTQLPSFSVFGADGFKTTPKTLLS